jgi:uncharacterized protein
MADPTAAITLSAAALAGIAGSGHCFGMCGGLAGALALRTRSQEGSAAALRRALLHHIGRLGGYALAGAACGFFGASLGAALDLPRLAVFLRVASAVTLMLIALRILFGWNAFVWLERLGARFWRKLQPLARRAGGNDDAGHALLLGLLWGWLPCGLVYSMLLFSILTGEAARGAAVMAAFGLGTLPSMLASSMIFAQLHQHLRRHWPRAITGILLLVFAAWLAWTSLPSQPGGHHHAALYEVDSSLPSAATAGAR